jgi:hypothetical protein
MTTVTAGSRLVIHGPESTLTLRTLRTIELVGDWYVPVMADLELLQAAGVTDATSEVDFPTDQGRLRLDAELLQTDEALVLRAPGLRTAAMIEQRRENVRGLVRLPLRGKVLVSSGAASRSQGAQEAQESDRPEIGVDLAGTTSSVSGGGISAELTMADWVDAGSKIYVEIEMPGGDLAPAVMTVLHHEGQLVRARFVDISALDRERLVRLVFARQRAELAERRRSADRR